MKLWLALLLLLIPALARSQIVADGSVTTATATTGTSCNFSHTTGAGSNRLAVARIYTHDATGLSTPTYNSASMTLAAQIENAGSGDYVGIYYLIAPASGAHTFDVSWSNSKSHACAFSTYTGAHQTTVLRDANTANNLSTGPPTVNLTSVDGNDYLVDIGAFGDAVGASTGVTLLAVSAGQTSDFNIDQSDDSANIAGSHDTGSGTVPMSWTFGSEQGAQYWELAAAAFIQAVVAPPASTRQRQVMILP